MQAQRFRNIQVAGLAAIAVFAACLPVRADLPGMPQPAEGTGEGTRPGDARPAAVTPTGPQRGSLFRQGVERPDPAGYTGPGDEPRSPASVSFIAVAPVQPKRYHKNDIVTVVISEISDSQINGSSASKKTQAYDLALQQFVQLALSNSGVPTVGTVNSPSSLPEIKFNYNNDRQSTAAQQRTDSFTARVSANVVDIKPNGTLVIEAVKQIVIDKEIQVFKLSGICRVEDIQGDNTILSTQLASLSVSKQTTGEVKDGTKRGWLNGWLDKFNPF